MFGGLGWVYMCASFFFFGFLGGADRLYITFFTLFSIALVHLLLQLVVVEY